MFKNLNLSRKNLLIFGVILTIFIVNQIFVFLIQNSSDKSSLDSLNAAGRNRMLSQRISAASFQILSGNQDAVKDLKGAIELHDSTINVLRNGGVVPKMKTQGPISPVSGGAVAELDKVVKLWEPYKACALILLNSPELVDANLFIGENYTKLLKANNALVKGLVKDSLLATYPASVGKAVINVAGRNRMLSQRIGLMAFKVLQGDQALMPKLEATIKLHQESFNVLVNGGKLADQNVEFPVISENLMPLVNNIKAVWEPYRDNAKVVVDAKLYLECIHTISKDYTALLKQNNALVQAIAKESQLADEASTAILNKILIALLLITIVVILLGYFGINKMIVDPMRLMAKQVETLSFGKIPEIFKMKRKDEIGVLNGSMNKLVDNVKSYSKFTEEIGEGNFEYEFEAASDEDELGKSLIGMRDQLRNVEEESKIRNWKTEGLAKFADILRVTDTTLEAFSQEVISSVVKYVGAVQGALFVVNESDPSNVLIERKGSYAYGREKFIDGAVKPGEGIVGQVYLEGKHVFLTDVPQNFMKVTSGLGDAEPSSVMVMPLMVNEQIMGIMELASFEKFTEAEIDFLLSLGESIAATLNSAKVNENTKHLLTESKMLEENLKSQEEELRQTMEEMQATQDSMLDREQELLKEIDSLKAENKKLKG